MQRTCAMQGSLSAPICGVKPQRVCLTQCLSNSSGGVLTCGPFVPRAIYWDLTDVLPVRTKLNFFRRIEIRIQLLLLPELDIYGALLFYLVTSVSLQPILILVGLYICCISWVTFSPLPDPVCFYFRLKTQPIFKSSGTTF